MEFILEITTEEMPSFHVKTGLFQLKEKIEQELYDLNIVVKRIRTFGTCRRLIIVGDFAQAQKIIREDIIGPPKTVAFEAGGSPSPAARGFAKAQGVSVNELEEIKTARGEYMGLKKIIEGIPTLNILLVLIPRIISSISFPKMMRWGDGSFRFSRPIKNILCLFDKKPLSLTIGEVSSDNFTIGHKIFSPKKIKVKSFPEYKEVLRKHKVVIDQEKRRQMILSQIEKKLASHNAKLHPDEELLEQLVYEVEHPYVFLGSFPEEYLKLPLEVLSTAMKVGQNLFSVVKGKKQLPFFLGVADACGDSKGLIRKGNERVLKARLEDAKFFWEQDLKVSLRAKSKKLTRVLFHEKLGSYEDKIQRLKKIVAYLSDKIEAKEVKKYSIQAAELSKVDLLTEMVREFPSLQGKIGGLYLKEEGYPEQVWKAVYEHYQPVSLDDNSPPSLGGAILSLADKLDSIVGTVGIGIEVTGSKDPFGLRRNAQGICKIVLERKLSFSFSRLLDKVLGAYGGRLERSKDEIKSYCLEFFSNRLNFIYEKQGYRYDLIKAALKTGIDNIYHTFFKVKALDGLKSSPNFEPLILISKRVNNILSGQPPYKVNPDLLVEKEERELYTTFSIIKENVLPLISKGDFSQAQKIAFRIRSSINNFFDHVLVMTEEKKLCRNRLALLQEISKLLIRIADYSLIVIEGQGKTEDRKQ